MAPAIASPTKEEQLLDAYILRTKIFFSELKRTIGKFTNQYISCIPALKEQEFIAQKTDLIWAQIEKTSKELNRSLQQLQQRNIIPLQEDYPTRLRLQYVEFQNAMDKLFVLFRLHLAKLEAIKSPYHQKCSKTVNEFAKQIQPHGIIIGRLVQAVTRRKAA